MGVVERLGDGGHQIRRPRVGGPVVPDDHREVAPLDELRDDVGEAVLRPAQVIDRDDVRVVEPREVAGFLQVGVHVLGSRDPLGPCDLDRDRPVKVVVVGQVDSPEASLAQDPEEPIAADPLRWLERGLHRRLGRRCLLGSHRRAALRSIVRECP